LRGSSGTRSARRLRRTLLKIYTQIATDFKHGVLIEVKFVTAEKETRSQTPGIFEDMFGYRGDLAWTHHFALIYCTDHSITQGELVAQFDRSGCSVDWTPIVMHGAGTRGAKTVGAA